MPLRFRHGEEVSPLTLTNRRVSRPCFDICEVFDSFCCVHSAECSIQNDYSSEDTFRILRRLSHASVAIILPVSIRV